MPNTHSCIIEFGSTDNFPKGRGERKLELMQLIHEKYNNSTKTLGFRGNGGRWIYLKYPFQNLWGGCIGNKICMIVINPAFESHYCKTLNILFVPHVFQWVVLCRSPTPALLLSLDAHWGISILASTPYSHDSKLPAQEDQRTTLHVKISGKGTDFLVS